MQSPANILKNPTAPVVGFHQAPDFTDREKYLYIQPNGKHLKYIYSTDLRVFKDRICGGFQYIPQFAKYASTKETTDGKIINLLAVIRMMKGATLKNVAGQIKDAQDRGDLALKKSLKENNLPYITHSGIFIPRQNDGLILPGFTYQLDIDKIGNADEVLAEVIKDNQLHVLIASKSVSGNGVKAILFLKDLAFLQDSWTHEQYRAAYHKATDILYDYFRQAHGVEIDKHMKSISQPFYLFYSPDLFIHKNLRTWI